MKILARLSLAVLVLLPAAAQGQPGERTVVDDPAALQRLRGNSGITLQWISFETPARGRVTVSERGGLVHLRGTQVERNGAGRLELVGDVLRIGANSFTFRGRIAISDTPEAGRECIRDGEYEFRVTQRRRYWRLQQMTVCDGLTDYVDIYF
jgi:hypothetical protein